MRSAVSSGPMACPTNSLKSRPITVTEARPSCRRRIGSFAVIMSTRLAASPRGVVHHDVPFADAFKQRRRSLQRLRGSVVAPDYFHGALERGRVHRVVPAPCGARLVMPAIRVMGMATVLTPNGVPGGHTSSSSAYSRRFTSQFSVILSIT
jgi:hypothetical protein